MMVTLHPNILERNGEKAFVILPYEEFLLMEEALQDLEDLTTLRAAKAAESDAPTVPLTQVRKALGIPERKTA